MILIFSGFALTSVFGYKSSCDEAEPGQSIIFFEGNSFTHSGSRIQWWIATTPPKTHSEQTSQKYLIPLRIYQKSSIVMHEFRSCKLLLSWRLKTNDLRDYLQRVIKQYFFVRFFFSLNFAIFQCDKNYEFRPLCKENSRSLTEKKVGYSFFA